MTPILKPLKAAIKTGSVAPGFTEHNLIEKQFEGLMNQCFAYLFLLMVFVAF